MHMGGDFMEELLTVKEVAKILNIKPATVRSKIKNGIIKGIKTDRIILIEKAEIEKLLESYKKKSHNLSIKYIGNF